MLVIFKSKGAADVIMYEEHAKRILDLLHKNTKRGVITAAEMGNAVASIEAEIAANRPSEHAAHDISTDSLGNPEKLPPVDFMTRAYPLLEMLRGAHKAGNDVAWGI